jgi:phage baseplate assembly protein W
MAAKLCLAALAYGLEDRVINKVDTAFLGRGWSFPPSFNHSDHSIEMVSDDEDIQQSLFILLSTSLGARIMLPEYGCDLSSYVFENLTTTVKTQMANDVESAIINWESRIDVDDIIIDENEQTPGKASIDVQYTIVKTNTRSNLVYPFYLAENTLSPTNEQG